MNKVLIIPFLIQKSIPEANYLSEGIIEELIEVITEIPNITSLGRNLSLYLQDHPTPGKELAKEFGVTHLLEGSIKNESNQVWARIRLIDAASEEIIASDKINIDLDKWTHSVNVATRKILNNNLSIRKQKESVEPQKKVRELYLKGLYHWNRYTHQEMKKAISFFNQALQLDPQYALAYSGLAECYSVIGVMGYDEITPAIQRATDNVTKALAIDKQHSEHYLAASFIHLFFQRDYSKAKANLTKALALNQTNSKTHHILSFYYVMINKVELSKYHCLKSIEFDPMAIPQWAMLIRLHIYKKEYTKALALIEATLLLDTNALPIIELRGLIELLTGNIESAIATYKWCVQSHPENELNFGFLALTLIRGGFIEEGKNIELLLESATPSPTNRYARAIIKFGFGNIDGFYFHVKQAMNANLSMIIGDLIHNPLLDEIKTDQRYQEFLIWAKLEDLNRAQKKSKPIEQFVISSNTKEELLLDPQDLIFIQADGNYSKIHWYSGLQVISTTLRITLGQLEHQFTNHTHVKRVHKSYIFNTDVPFKITGNAKGYFIQLSNPIHQIPISRNKSKLVQDLITP